MRESIALAILRETARWVAGMPLERALRLGRGLGWVLGKVVRWRRWEVLHSLRRSLPELSLLRIRRICDEMYAQQGMNLVEMLRLTVLGPQDLEGRVQVKGWEYLRESLQRGRGAIILTAHLGNWDLLGILGLRHGIPVTIITKGVKNSAVDRFWQGSRRRLGINLVPARDSYRTCLRALHRNEVVGFILDQNMIREEGVFVEFFGQPACTTPGLAYMAAHSGASVVPVFTVRDSTTHHVVRLLPPLAPPADRRPETIRQATQEYTRIIEEMIRRHPEQWIWMHRRWRTRPPA